LSGDNIVVTNINKLLEKAGSLAKKREYDSAFEVIDDLINRFPEEPEVWRKRAYINARMRNFEQAVSDLEAAIKINDSEPDYYYTRGRYCFSLGRYEDSISDFTSAIDVSVEHSETYYLEPSYLMRAECYLRLGEFDLAKLDCEKVSENTTIRTDSLRSKNDILNDCNKH